ncbi:MAG: UDP-N-acetylmuramate--L-alanine ligase [Planctomycetota bacterium]|jgi:UDP-N-acetylmuramate--alanine ligase|nr:UDP-N-acetylmuramate--L-alanine ligase [Planctomycetota bacterium]
MELAGERWHFMGVGGIGMSALAEMAALRGATVSGCDRESGRSTVSLAARGIDIRIGHDPAHAADADVLVYSSAIPADHPERLAMRGRQIGRGELLAAFMDEAEVKVGVAGTHGKTTTTWLLGQLLLGAGIDPTLYVGGVAPGLDRGNYRLGQGPFVSELDESDGSFLLPQLDVAAVANIEADHLSHYGDFSSVQAAFRRYADGVSDAGLLVAGLDDPGAAALFSDHSGRKLSFGLTRSADLHPVELVSGGGGSTFRAMLRGSELGVFHLPLHGIHNVKNALAALGTAIELGADVEALRGALAGATGVGRRLERLGFVGQAVLYSDYAHHPTEVAAAIQALRETTEGKILVAFQPHLFTRTRDNAEDFARALARADSVMLLEIYPAREDPIPGVDSLMIVERIRSFWETVDVSGPYTVDDITAAVRRKAAGFSVVVMMGAGDIDAAARRLAREGA